MADFQVGDQVHTDTDSEIGLVRYIYKTLDSVTVEYQSQRGAGTYTEDWPTGKLVFHARPVFLNDDALTTIAQVCFDHYGSVEQCDSAQVAEAIVKALIAR